MTIVLTRQPPEQARAPKLHVFIEAKDGVPVHEAIMKVNQVGVRLASNRVIDAFLNSEGINSIRYDRPSLTGTMCAYVKPGKTFRQVAQRISSLDNEYYQVYNDPCFNDRWLYHVREDYLDKKDALLICEHPNFLFLVDGKDRIIRPYEAGIITGFPAEMGWYPRQDSKYGIPFGRKIFLYYFNDEPSDPFARYLHRKTEEVGFIVRGFKGYGNPNRVISHAKWVCGHVRVIIVRDESKIDFEGHPYRGSYSISTQHRSLDSGSATTGKSI